MLEVNPRASRTVPFVAKAIGLPVAGIAARVMAGEKLAAIRPHARAERATSRSRKRCMPFARFPGVDTMLGPEMRSTGEVMGLDSDFGRAFAKSQIGGGLTLPLAGTVFVSVKNADKEETVEPVRRAGRDGLRYRGHARHGELSCRRRAFPCAPSTRCWRAARISSTR